MDGQTTQNLGKAMGTDTKKLAVGKQDLSATIGNEGSKHLKSDQIPPNLDKREKEIAKRRSHDN